MSDQATATPSDFQAHPGARVGKEGVFEQEPRREPEALIEREAPLTVGQAQQLVVETPPSFGTPLVLRTDADVAERPVEEVDCSARIPICNAVCCKLDFPLTRGEVLAGKVQWNLARPFFIGRAASGYCAHNDRSTGGCMVYADRPAICRRWSCAKDRRIWKDFENVELNVEWLSAHGFISEDWALASPAPCAAVPPAGSA